MKIIIPHKLSGRISLNAVKSDNTKREILPWVKNVVLNTGLDLLGTTHDWLDCCHVGTNNTATDKTQTSLLTPAAATNNRVAATNVMTDVAPYAAITTLTYQFGLGQVTGVIKELGFGPTVTLGSHLFNRALITDNLGNENQSIVNPDEALEVNYEITLDIPSTDIIGTLMFDGNPIDYKVRACYVDQPAYWSVYRAENFATGSQGVLAAFSTANGSQVTAYDGPIGSVTAHPSGNSDQADYYSTLPYTTGSYHAVIRAEWDIASAVFQNGIKSILWTMGNVAPITNGGNSLGAYQIEFTTPITKTNEEGFRIDLGIAWSNQG